MPNIVVPDQPYCCNFLFPNKASTYITASQETIIQSAEGIKIKTMMVARIHKFGAPEIFVYEKCQNQSRKQMS